MYKRKKKTINHMNRKCKKINMYKMKARRYCKYMERFEWMKMIEKQGTSW